MKKLLNTKEIKAIQIEILNSIDRFCQTHSLRYSLAYGTLLGAVRHKGFIPWDDDIDLMMPRPDYEQFLHDFCEDNLIITDLASRYDCVETFIKVCRKGTVMVDKNFGRELWGVNVDVFPIDGAPEKGLDQHYASLDALREKNFQLCPYYKSVHKGRYSLMLKYILKRLRYPCLSSFKTIKKKLADLQKSIPYDSSKMVGIYFASEKTRTFFEKALYEEIGTLSFEGKNYPAILAYDHYLTILYGDYMQLPPNEKRVSHHAYNAFIEL